MWGGDRLSSGAGQGVPRVEQPVLKLCTAGAAALLGTGSPREPCGKCSLCLCLQSFYIEKLPKDFPCSGPP